MVIWATLFCHCEPWRDNSSVTHLGASTSSAKWVGFEAWEGGATPIHESQAFAAALEYHCMNGTSRGIQEAFKSQ